MSDPYTAQGVARMFPGTLGGRAGVATPVSPFRRPVRRKVVPVVCPLKVHDGYEPYTTDAVDLLGGAALSAAGTTWYAASADAGGGSKFRSYSYPDFTTGAVSSPTGVTTGFAQFYGVAVDATYGYWVRHLTTNRETVDRFLLASPYTRTVLQDGGTGGGRTAFQGLVLNPVDGLLYVMAIASPFTQWSLRTVSPSTGSMATVATNIFPSNGVPLDTILRVTPDGSVWGLARPSGGGGDFYVWRYASGSVARSSAIYAPTGLLPTADNTVFAVNTARTSNVEVDTSLTGTDVDCEHLPLDYPDISHVVYTTATTPDLATVAYAYQDFATPFGWGVWQV